MRADRLLSILLLLQVHRRVTARDLAKRLEVSERTVLRDMDALSGAGVPVIAERGAGGGWSLAGAYQTKLTGLNAAEIQSLFLARAPQLMTDLGLKLESDAAMIKLQASLPAGSRQHADFARQRILVDARGWRDPAESVACLPMLLEALWTERQVTFIYHKVLGEPGERIAHPLGLVAKGSTWYLIARAEPLRDDPHTYRVSRIREAAILEQPARRPAGFDLARYWEHSATEFREKLPRYYAAFLASRAAMRWVRYRGWRLEEEIDAGDTVRIRLRFDAEDEAIQFALSLGGQVEAIDPPELRDKVLAGARAMMGLYGGMGWEAAC